MTSTKKLHSFHIPVMGLAYTIDSPIRVAHFGIDSVVSIVDDELMEKMNAFYSKKFALPYKEISTAVHDFRAQRITSYLDVVDKLVKKNFRAFCEEMAVNKDTLLNFIAMLPQLSDLKRGLQFYASSAFDKSDAIRAFLARHLQPGAIDVNIMTKVDKTNYIKHRPLPGIYNDAHAALRGFAQSTLNSSLVLSAGMNPSLYSYSAGFDDFFPDEKGKLKKKIILKVSDFRSALIQGSFLAKKGIWVSEYRIESGLNCGGHAFATDGLLLGPIMEEFKQRRQELTDVAHGLMAKALLQKQMAVPQQPLPLNITVQGGVGTAQEHQFLIEHYKADSVGWGSPFLLVPQATATDAATRQLLINAREHDFYRSDISPLGVPFNTVSGTTNEAFKNERIANGRAGSSCPKKLLALNTEYGDEGICTASHKYQKLKLGELEQQKAVMPESEYYYQKEAITVKSCLCVGLANAAYLENNMPVKGEQQGVVICPGPNMAYFDKEVSLKDMLRHIYGYASILADAYRPNMFIKELQLYAEYFKKGIENVNKTQLKKWHAFKHNLIEGITYYETLFTSTAFFKGEVYAVLCQLAKFKEELALLEITETTEAEYV